MDMLLLLPILMSHPFCNQQEMLTIVRAIYKMTGQMVQLPPDEDTPEKVRTNPNEAVKAAAQL